MMLSLLSFQKIQWSLLKRNAQTCLISLTHQYFHKLKTKSITNAVRYLNNIGVNKDLKLVDAKFLETCFEAYISDCLFCVESCKNIIRLLSHQETLYQDLSKERQKILNILIGRFFSEIKVSEIAEFLMQLNQIGYQQASNPSSNFGMIFKGFLKKNALALTKKQTFSIFSAIYTTGLTTKEGCEQNSIEDYREEQNRTFLRKLSRLPVSWSEYKKWGLASLLSKILKKTLFKMSIENFQENLGYIRKIGLTWKNLEEEELDKKILQGFNYHIINLTPRELTDTLQNFYKLGINAPLFFTHPIIIKGVEIVISKNCGLMDATITSELLSIMSPDFWDSVPLILKNSFVKTFSQSTPVTRRAFNGKLLSMLYTSGVSWFDIESWGIDKTLLDGLDNFIKKANSKEKALVLIDCYNLGMTWNKFENYKNSSKLKDSSIALLKENDLNLASSLFVALTGMNAIRSVKELHVLASLFNVPYGPSSVVSDVFLALCQFYASQYLVAGKDSTAWASLNPPMSLFEFINQFPDVSSKIASGFVKMTINEHNEQVVLNTIGYLQAYLPGQTIIPQSIINPKVLVLLLPDYNTVIEPLMPRDCGLTGHIKNSARLRILLAKSLGYRVFALNPHFQLDNSLGRVLSFIQERVTEQQSKCVMSPALVGPTTSPLRFTKLGPQDPLGKKPQALGYEF